MTRPYLDPVLFSSILNETRLNKPLVSNSNLGF